MSEKAPKRARFELDFEEGAIRCLVKIPKDEEEHLPRPRSVKGNPAHGELSISWLTPCPLPVPQLGEVGGHAPLELCVRRSVELLVLQLF